MPPGKHMLRLVWDAQQGPSALCPADPFRFDPPQGPCPPFPPNFSSQHQFRRHRGAAHRLIPTGAHLAPLGTGSRDLTLQMPHKVGTLWGSAAAPAGATAGQVMPPPRCYSRELKELHVTTAFW